jgi:transposase
VEDAGDELPDAFRLLVQRLLEHFKDLERQLHDIDDEIVAWHRQNDDSRKLAEMPGIGPITASAMVASIGDAKTFKNGRQVSAWLGLVPKQNSTGGKTVLLGMSKRGDSYLRTMLIQGARSVIYAAQRKKEALDGWLGGLLKRRNANVAAVALANKNARTIWALLAHGREFRPDYAAA